MTWIVPLRRGDVGLDDLRRAVEEHGLPATRIAIVGPASVFAELSFTMRERGDVALHDVVEQDPPEGRLVRREACRASPWGQP